MSEPNSEYMGHFTPESGTARSISRGLAETFEEKGISLNELSAEGCDGTVTNTGTKGGIIKLLEDRLGRPLHWFVCQLHANELPLRHLFSSLDGKTSGPRCFTGPIGRLLANCEIRPVVDFEPISFGDMPSIDIKELSTDQKYLYEIHISVAQGSVPDDLANRSPGNLNHARWLTTANRIFRLYVATESPSDGLKSLCYLVMNMYAPMWFTLKTNPFVQDGPLSLIHI